MKKGLINFCSLVRCRKQTSICEEDGLGEGLEEGIEENSAPRVVITVQPEQYSQQGRFFDARVNRDNQMGGSVIEQITRSRRGSAIMSADEEYLCRRDVADNGEFVIEGSEEEEMVEIPLYENDRDEISINSMTRR